MGENRGDDRKKRGWFKIRQKWKKRLRPAVLRLRDKNSAKTKIKKNGIQTGSVTYAHHHHEKNDARSMVRSHYPSTLGKLPRPLACRRGSLSPLPLRMEHNSWGFRDLVNEEVPNTTSCRPGNLTKRQKHTRTCNSIVAIIPSVFACSRNSGNDFARNIFEPPPPTLAGRLV